MDKNVKLVLGVAVVGGVIALAYKYFNNDEKKSNARGTTCCDTGKCRSQYRCNSECKCERKIDYMPH